MPKKQIVPDTVGPFVVQLPSEGWNWEDHSVVVEIPVSENLMLRVWVIELSFGSYQTRDAKFVDTKANIELATMPDYSSIQYLAPVLARMDKPRFTPASYGIITKTKEFKDWGVGDLITTHEGRKAFIHAQPWEDTRTVNAMYLDASDGELAQPGHDIPLTEIANHTGYGSKGDQRNEYIALTQRAEQVRRVRRVN